MLVPDAGAAWRHGLGLGIGCTRSCAGLTVVMLTLGVMDVRVMTVLAAAITLERLASNGARVARFIGMMVVMAGMFMILREPAFG
jgi:predicted metal-binding membrane protein